MKKIIYESQRHFAIFDAFVSHNQLLIRSQKKEESDHNVDIIFFDTAYLQIVSKLNGICIREISIDDAVVEYESVLKHCSYPNNRFYKIESNQESYYIAASFVKVFENRLEFDQSSLNFDNRGREKEIASG